MTIPFVFYKVSPVDKEDELENGNTKGKEDRWVLRVM